LVNAVVPEVIAHAVEVARSIAAHAPQTVAGIKSVMNAQQGKPVAEGLRYAAAWNAAFLQSADFAQAAAAFRRPAPPDKHLSDGRHHRVDESGI
jgi:delta(3,5)-delta(2,4)-dienoyl-CoA isomerase